MAGTPRSQCTPVASAVPGLHWPGPRQTCATFHTPPMQASSSNPPGAHADASLGSFGEQAFPAAGGPAGRTSGFGPSPAPLAGVVALAPASGVGSTASADASAAAGGAATAPPSAAGGEVAGFLHAWRNGDATENAITAATTGTKAAGMERMANEGNIAA